MTATLDAEKVYSSADFVVIAAPTNYDSKHFVGGGFGVRMMLDILLFSEKYGGLIGSM